MIGTLVMMSMVFGVVVEIAVSLDVRDDDGPDNHCTEAAAADNDDGDCCYC